MNRTIFLLILAIELLVYTNCDSTSSTSSSSSSSAGSLLCPGPNPCPRPHEELQCVVSCQRRTCSFKDLTSKCAGPCAKECVCEQGYRRINDDLTSLCIPEKKCPKYYDFFPPDNDSNQGNSSTSPICCGGNEAPRRCGNVCRRTCATRKFLCRFICLSKTETCDCADGFYRSKCGKCIEENECDNPCVQDTIPSCFGANETPDGCFNPETEETCDNLYDEQKKDSTSDLCVLGVCHCVKGFVRNRCGECVDPKDCYCNCDGHHTVCTGPNEIPVDCYNEYTAKKCPGIESSNLYFKNKRCQKGKCDCIEGYLRNKDGICVQEEECDSDIPKFCTNPCTKKNEVYRCLNFCLERKCSSIGILAKCVNNCTGGCDCIEGYRRNDDDECILERDCPKSTEAPA